MSELCDFDHWIIGQRVSEDNFQIYYTNINRTESEQNCMHFSYFHIKHVNDHFQNWISQATDANFLLEDWKSYEYLQSSYISTVKHGGALRQDHCNHIEIGHVSIIKE